MKLKRLVPAVILLFTAAGSVTAQTCKVCSSAPRVNLYEFDVKVPRPEDPKQLGKWTSLFFLSRHVNARLFESNKDCVRFLQALEQDSGGNDVLKVGVTHALLPGQGDVSKYGDYLVTGTVTGGGVHFNATIQLQSACSREVIHQLNYSFQLPHDSSNTAQAAEHIASQLSPLADKIMDHAAKKRESEPKVAYSSWGKEALKIVPKKRNLVAGEETEISITLTDCDGKLLANREIRFDKSSIHGFAILGTTGGTVTPATVTTDANGKARAKFKMGDKKEAIIAAHHKFDRPSGCNDAFTGSTVIGGVPLKITVDYATNQQSKFNPEIDLGGAKMVGGKEEGNFSRTFRAVLYHYPEKNDEGYLVYVAPELPKNRTIYETLAGNFAYRMTRQHTDAEAFLAGQKIHQETVEDAENHSNSGRPGNANTPYIFFRPGNKDRTSELSLEFNFSNEAEHEIGTGSFSGSIGVMTGDKGVQFITNKVNDPQSPYKTEYVIDVNRDPGDFSDAEKFGFSVKGIEKIYKISGVERMTVRILSPY